MEQVNIINNDSHESINNNKLNDVLNDEDENIVNTGHSKFEVEDDSKAEESLIQDKMYDHYLNHYHTEDTPFLSSYVKLHQIHIQDMEK